MEILKWINRHSCQVCYGNEGPTECDDWKEELGHNKNGPCAARLFADKNQLKGLIEEAEAGAQKWVRDNTLFVCSKVGGGCPAGCHYSNPHNYCEKKIACGLVPEKITIPFRGKKGEPQVFGTYVESSEVEKRFICDNYWADIGCDGDGEESCSLMAPHCKPDQDSIRNCYAPKEIESRKKEDRSDNEFNEKRESFKAAVNEAELKWFPNPHGIANSGPCIVEQVREMAVDGLEYVVIKDFKHFDLAITDIDPVCFKQISSECQNLHFCKDEIIRFKGEEWDIVNSELLRLGFIEEKVCDYPVELGFHFKRKDSCLYRMVKIEEDSYGLLCITHSEISPYFETVTTDECMLSDLVGKDRLRDFTPVKVTVTEVE